MGSLSEKSMMHGLKLPHVNGCGRLSASKQTRTKRRTTTMPDIMLESIYRGIGERIAKRRQEWHVTQSALSQKTHLPIGRIEMGLDTPSVTALYSIAHALCCPVAWLLPESENEEQP